MKEIAALSKRLKEPDWLLEERLSSFELVPKGFSFRLAEPKKLTVRKSKNVKIHTLSEIIRKDSKFAKGIFLFRQLKADRSPYAAYLNSMFRECSFMFVDKGKKAELDLLSNASLAMTFVFLGEGSSLRLSNIAVSDSLNIVEVKAEENARLDAGFLKHKGAFAYHGQAAEAGTGSIVNFASFWSGSGYGDTLSELKGIGSKALHVELSTGGDEEKIALNSGVLHSANDAASRVVMKGVAQDSSETLFNGNVGVESNGRGSKSLLEQHILLLDEGARAEARPVLEIKNNDVECSHSAAVRQIEEEKLFYLQTRGLSRRTAKTTMITGFLRSAINMVRDRELRNMFKPPFMQD